MKIPETLRVTVEMHNSLIELGEKIDGETDRRGLLAPQGTTASDIVAVALDSLQLDQSEDIVGRLVDRALG